MLKLPSFKDKVEAAIEDTMEVVGLSTISKFEKRMLENQALICRLLQPKAKKVKKPTKPRERNLEWDMICEVWKWTPQTATERTRCGKLAKEYKAKGISKEQLKPKIIAYKINYPGCACTPEALIKHWDFLHVEDNSEDLKKRKELEENLGKSRR